MWEWGWSCLSWCIQILQMWKISDVEFHTFRTKWIKKLMIGIKYTLCNTNALHNVWPRTTWMKRRRCQIYTNYKDLVHNNELGHPLISKLKISSENILVIIHLWPMRGDLDKKTFVCWNDCYTYVRISLLQKLKSAFSLVLQYSCTSNTQILRSCNIVAPQILWTGQLGRR